MATDALAHSHRPLRKSVQFVELDGTHSGFLRLRVKISRESADRIEAHCRDAGLHAMVFYCDLFNAALESMLMDLGLSEQSDLDDSDVGF